MNRLIFFLLSVMFLLAEIVKANEVYLNCFHKIRPTTQISLSYNIKENSGKEYVGQGLSIPYDLEITESNITMINGKLVRSWNINRINGDAQLYHPHSISDLIFYSCSRATKKL
jgi:hypothetical protein